MIGPENTVSLSGGGLTVHTLELIVEISNKHGEVLVKDIGRSSLMQIAVDLLNYAKVKEAQHP